MRELRVYVLPILATTLCYIFYWFKANSRDVYGFDWGPFKWWLYTGLVTNYIGLWAWWRLVEVSDVWRAGVLCMITSLIVDLMLNSIFYSYNPRGVVALVLCAIAAYIVHQ